MLTDPAVRGDPTHESDHEGQMFDDDTCRVCGGTFDWGGEERKIAHAEFHTAPKVARPNTQPPPDGEALVLAQDAAMRKLRLVTADGRVRLIGRPGADKLTRHIKLYGPEGVAEAVRPFGTNGTSLAAFKTDAPTRRRTTREMVETVIGLASQGFRPGPIARTLNLSERRVRTIIASAWTPRGAAHAETALARPVFMRGLRVD